MEAWSSGSVVSNGIKIHYQRSGGAGHPLVLLHGFSDSGRCWLRAAQVLQRDYDVIMPDARGHGLSDAPETGYGTEEQAADAAGLIQALGLDRPAVMGHSMGAATTAALAAGYPELVGCVILEDPPWFDENSPRYRERFAAAPEQRQAMAEQQRAEIIARKAKSLDEVMANGRTNSPAWDEIEFEPWAESKLQLSPNVVNRFEITRRPWAEIVKQIECPALLITADPQAGAIVTPDIARQAAAINDRIELVHIPGAGHNIRREQFTQFLEAVTAFLAAHC